MSILSPVGKVSKVFGLDGKVVINLYDSFPGDVNFEEPLFVKVDGLAVPLFIEHFERRGRSGALIRFMDIDSPSRASEFVSSELFAETQDAGELRDRRGVSSQPGSPDTGNGMEEELFLEDLEGYVVSICEDGGKTIRGVISSFIESEMNPLFLIEADGREILIPAAEEFIMGIYSEKREIEFLLPEGLLELYI